MAFRIASGEATVVPAPARPSAHVAARRALRGFTLIELIVVMAIVSLLLTLALPRYFQSIDTSKETVLKENLRTVRETIDKFYGDTGRYPESLEELVERKYLRAGLGERVDVLGVGVELPGAHGRAVARVEDEHHRLAAVVSQ